LSFSVMCSGLILKVGFAGMLFSSAVFILENSTYWLWLRNLLALGLGLRIWPRLWTLWLHVHLEIETVALCCQNW